MSFEEPASELVAQPIRMDESLQGNASVRVVRLEAFEPPFTLATDQQDPYLRRFNTLFVDDARSKQGSTGCVLHATNAYGEQLALKVHDAASVDEVRTAAFQRERDAHRMVSEIKGFPRLYGSAVLDDKPLLVMEWLEGEPLYRALPRAAADDEGRVPPLVVARLGRDLFDILARTSALEHPVVHGDLSLANIMIGTSRQSVEEQVQEGAFDLRVIDLSSAEVSGDPHRAPAGMCAATPEFAAPETLDASRETELTQAADVYAAARLLSFLLYGESGANSIHGPGNDLSAMLLHEPEVAVAVSRASADLVPAATQEEVADALALVDEPLEELLRSCLEANPANRPSATQMRDALESFCSGYTENIGHALRGEMLEPCTAPFIYKGVDRFPLRTRTLIRVIGKGLSFGLLIAVIVIAGAVLLIQGASLELGDVQIRGVAVLGAAAALALPAALGFALRGRALSRPVGLVRGSIGVIVGALVLAGLGLQASFMPPQMARMFFAAVFAATAMAWCPLVLDLAFPPLSARVRKRMRGLPGTNGSRVRALESGHILEERMLKGASDGER